uniref:Histidine kinase n=1 Tax=Heterorhabditis bacteriophora TaxID=37862 RepID=A0A1I7XBD9_HETBA
MEKRMLSGLMRQQKEETAQLAEVVEKAINLQVRRVKDVMTPIEKFRYVSSETPVTQMMLELKRGFPLAIVIDFHENKRIYDVVGLITLEDNLEEVGLNYIFMTEFKSDIEEYEYELSDTEIEQLKRLLSLIIDDCYDNDSGNRIVLAYKINASQVERVLEHNQRRVKKVVALVAILMTLLSLALVALSLTLGRKIDLMGAFL